MKLKKYLKKEKLNQTQFADLAGISDAMVCRILKDDGYNPRINAIARIVRFTKGAVKFEDFITS